MSKAVRVILQARTSSSRLPGKVLMHVGGMPLAVLCARRLANTGLDVVVATSTEASDDRLVNVCEQYQVPCFRGDLNDVRGRFLACAEELPDSYLIVRVTADNPLPDGDFIGLLIQQFQQSGTQYLATHENDGLPYGMSAEVFYLSSLRKAAAASESVYDKEHVTPQLRSDAAKGGEAFFDPTELSGSGDERVTVDTLADYLRMARLFELIGDPEHALWSEYLALLPRLDDSVSEFSSRPITLGTAQLGMKYGVNNTVGKPGDEEARRLLAEAARLGVRYIDSASAYGDSERRIGRLSPACSRFSVITKLAPMDSTSGQVASTRELELLVDSGVFAALNRLNRQHIDVMMFHRSEDLLRHDGAALARLMVHQRSGLVGQVGVSVSTPEEAIACLQTGLVSHLQVPFNLLDMRWLNNDFQQAIINSKQPVHVHVRSVFLQGLLLAEPDSWPVWYSERKLVPLQLRAFVKHFDRESLVDLCIAYVRSHRWVSTCVVGVETAAQLREIIRFADRPPLSVEQAAAIQSSFTDVSERLINPALWKLP